MENKRAAIMIRVISDAVSFLLTFGLFFQFDT